MDDIGLVNYAAQPYSVELREIPKATIGPDDVLLDVQAVAVCGSDLHMWMGTPSWTIEYPVVLGHEFGGIVREVGDRVTGWSEGDRAASETAAVVDPDSPLTRRGLYNLDPGRHGYGAVIDGAMRRYVPVPARILHRLPDNVSFEAAALTEPCCVAYNAVVNNASIKPGDRIVVLGPGTIGLLCAAIASLHGGEVAVVGLDRDSDRLEVARQYGCHTIVGDPTQWAMATDGLGADGVIDAAGVSPTLKMAVDIVRPAGWICKVGWGIKPLDFSLDPLVQKGVRLQGTFSHNWPVWERVIRMLSTGQLDVAPVIGGVWPLKQWQQAFEKMHAAEIVKAVLKPDQT